MPSTSPGRGARVVAETLKYRSGTRSRRQRTTLDLPTADGPDSTTTRPACRLSGPPPAFTVGSGEVELLQQRLALPVAQAAQPAGGGDLQLGHDLLRLDLADLRQRLQQRRHLHLAQDLVGLGVLEHLLEIGAATLEPVLELRSGPTCGRRLLQRGGALLVGQLGKGHDSSVSSSPATPMFSLSRPGTPAQRRRPYPRRLTKSNPTPGFRPQMPSVRPLRMGV